MTPLPNCVHPVQGRRLGYTKMISPVQGEGIGDCPHLTQSRKGVFQGLPTYLITKHETTEISVAFTAIGALLVALAIVLALIWHPLP